MNYINPYKLLSIKPKSDADNTKDIKSAKKRFLAEIRLDGDVMVDGVSVDKSSALKAFDELDDENLRELHAHIFHDHLFCNLLTSGDTDWFYFEPEEYTFEKRFRNYLTPFFIKRFEETLTAAVASEDADLALLILDSRFPLPPENPEHCYRGIKKLLSERITEISEKAEDVELEECLDVILPSNVELIEKNQNAYEVIRLLPKITPLKNFKDSLLSENLLRILNALPAEFDLMRENFADGLRHLAVIVHNFTHELEVSLYILEVAEKIDTNSRVKNNIVTDRREIENRIAKLNLVNLSNELDEIILEIKDRKFTNPREIENKVVSILNIGYLNDISKTEFNTFIINIVGKVCEIAWLISTSFHIPEISISIIEKCLELRLSEPSVSKSLLNKLIEVRFELERNRQQIVNTAFTANETKYDQNRSRPRKTAFTDKNSSQPNRATKSRKPTPSMFDQYQESTNQAGILSSLLTVLGDFRTDATVKIAFLLGGAGILGFIFFILILLKEPAPIAQSNSIAASKNSSGMNIQLSGNNNTNYSPSANQPTENKFSATPLPSPKITRPLSGAVLSKVSGGGYGQLIISNGTSDDAVAKLIDQTTGKKYREIYIRSNSDVTVRSIRQGNYSLYFSTGQDYSEKEGRFLNNASYSKFDEIFYYEESRNQYGVGFRKYNVSLQPVSYGTASTSKIGESEFATK